MKSRTCKNPNPHQAHEWSYMEPSGEYPGTYRVCDCPGTEVEAHWKTIMAGNIVIAGGYCYCGNPDAKKHYLGFIPAGGYDNDE